MKKLIFILFILLCCEKITTIASEYYISTTGSNANSGSIIAPWQTLSYACTKTVAGDVIHIIKGNYIEPNKCLLSAHVKAEANAAIKFRYQTSSLTDGAIVINANGVKIEGLTIDGDGLTGDNAIIIYNKSNVTLENCLILDFHIEGVRFESGSNNRVNNCIISNCSGVSGGDRKYGLFVRGQIDFIFENSTFHQVQRSGANTTGDGIRVEDGNRSPIFRNNVLRGLYADQAPLYEWSFLFEAWSNNKVDGIGHGLQFYGNDVSGEIDFGSGLNKGSYPYSAYIHDNKFGDDVTHGPQSSRIGLQFEEIIWDVIIERNEFRNLDRPIYFCNNSTAGDFRRITIDYNKIWNVPFNYSSANSNSGSHGSGFGIVIAGSGSGSPIQDFKVRNNTITADPSNPAGIGVWIDTRGVVQRFTVQNNIIQGFTEAAYGTASGGGSMSYLTVQKNLLWNNGNSNNLLLTGITVSNLVNDGGIKANPLFTSDYHLQSGSPAINAGIDLGLLLDLENKAVSKPPEIGCLEYGAVVVPSHSTLGALIFSGGRLIIKK